MLRGEDEDDVSSPTHLVSKQNASSFNNPFSPSLARGKSIQSPQATGGKKALAPAVGGPMTSARTLSKDPDPMMQAL